MPAIDLPDPDRTARAESLAAELTELCAYRYALEAKFLRLLAEFDREQFWERLGLHSCAHWLNLKCGIGLNAAREKVRVARSLEDLPKIAAAFAEGSVSFSKVRAMTRVATADNQDYLLMIARHGTAYHVETLVRKFRRVQRLRTTAHAGESSRALHTHTDENGMLVIQACMMPDQGAVVLKALQAAVERQPDVTAETREPLSSRRADALAELAEVYLGSDVAPNNTADRHQVVVHVTAETLADPAADERVAVEMPQLDDGPGVTAETSRRLACDASLVRLIKGEQGEPLSIGRKSRSIPPPLRRALLARDKGCRFPGCTQTRFVDGHHIVHWAHGGETSLGNLVLLCRSHHRLVHEGGFICERRYRGNVEFRDPEGRLLDEKPGLKPLPRGEDPTEWLRHTFERQGIDSETCVARWYAGESIDWGLAVAHLDTA